MVAGRSVEQLADLVGRKEVRQLAVAARVAQRLGGVAVGQPFALGELVERAERGQPAGDGGLGVARFVQGRDVAAEVERRDLGGRGLAAVSLVQIVGQRSEVFAVGLDGQRGGVALDREEAEELGDGGVHRSRHEAP